MAKISVGDQFPAATLKDIDGSTVDIPGVFVTGRKSEMGLRQRERLGPSEVDMKIPQKSPDTGLPLNKLILRMHQKSRPPMAPPIDKPVSHTPRDDIQPA